jgi:hypothetical protein
VFILYVLLVLCTVALVGAVLAGYLKIRRHMRGSDKALRKALTEIEQEKTGTRTGV